ncbi:MAG: TonB-dependent receptor, partial [Bacteroidota bacterium]
ETMGSRSYFYSRSSFGEFESSTDLDSLGLSSSTGSLFGHVDLDGRIIAEGAKRFSLGLGARWNNHSGYGSNATMEVSPSYRISDQSLVYASYSTGFNAPSLYQLFVPNADFVSGITRGNRNLQPETSGSYEVGLKYRFQDKVSFNLSYFSTEVRNVIEYIYLWDKDVGIDTLGNDWMRNDFRGDTYLNLGNLITRGFEASLHIRLSEELLLTGAVSLVGGKLRYDPSTLDLRQTAGHHVQVYNNGAFITKAVESLGLTRRPDTFHASLAYTPVQEFSARLDLKHAGSRMDVYYNSDLGPYGALGTVGVEEYTLLDLAARYNITPQLSLNLRVENLLDTRYLEINGFTTRGRGLFANVRYS